MELGNKIKSLRLKSGLTQEQLAEQLGISAQSVSKWETAVAMPDITLLPEISTVFGVSIDELFDLTKEQRLLRIENRMEAEAELSADVFCEYEEYLKGQLEENDDKQRIMRLLGHLYHHRMLSDAKKVSRYAREAIRLAPAKKDAQWLLQLSEGHLAWDWNISNHSSAVEFYKDVIESCSDEPKPALPYYYLLDNLIADHRAQEAKKYLDEASSLPSFKPFLKKVYEAHIALAEFDEKRADEIIKNAMKTFSDNPGFLFEAAQYYAKKCEYKKAVECYEKSYESEKDSKPRFIDALQGIAVIFEITGENKKAAATYERILDNLRNEWGFTDEAVVKEYEEKRNRLLNNL